MMANLDKPPRNESVSSMHDWTQRNTEYPSSDGGSVSRTDSVGATLWNWANGRSTGPSAQTTPATSRDASVDGGAQFAGGTLPGGAGGIPSVASNGSLWNWRSSLSRESSVASSMDGGGGMTRNSSVGITLWNWANGRNSPPSSEAGSSREPSVKGGNAFLAGGGGGPGVDGPAPSPKDYSSSHGGMPRNSSASRLWAFGQGAGRSPTTSPPVSREASAHAGSELRGLGAMRLSVPGTSHGTTGSPAPSPK
mmetsp:Transcript_27025/g.88728  ORF Transcript_27025/g.88728 Transcript_27025/m.88728 type:complete len:251 (-) Transcript_27025:439-1191(-)